MCDFFNAWSQNRCLSNRLSLQRSTKISVGEALSVFFSFKSIRRKLFLFLTSFDHLHEINQIFEHYIYVDEKTKRQFIYTFFVIYCIVCKIKKIYRMHILSIYSIVSLKYFRNMCIKNKFSFFEYHIMYEIKILYTLHNFMYKRKYIHIKQPFLKHRNAYKTIFK